MWGHFEKNGFFSKFQNFKIMYGHLLTTSTLLFLSKVVANGLDRRFRAKQPVIGLHNLKLEMHLDFFHFFHPNFKISKYIICMSWTLHPQLFLPKLLEMV
jgi:hypothetical protein